MTSKLKIATFKYIRHKLIASNAFPLIQYSESVPICTTDEDDVDEVVDYTTSRMQSPMATILPRISETSRCITR